MSQCYIQDTDDDAPCKCDNCDHECRGDELDMISDIEQRLTPGGVVPAGQCPECGALAYLDEPSEPSEPRAYYVIGASEADANGDPANWWQITAASASDAASTWMLSDYQGESDDEVLVSLTAERSDIMRFNVTVTHQTTAVKVS